jgi:hypothetical protein
MLNLNSIVSIKRVTARPMTANPDRSSIDVGLSHPWDFRDIQHILAKELRESTQPPTLADLKNGSVERVDELWSELVTAQQRYDAPVLGTDEMSVGNVRSALATADRYLHDRSDNTRWRLEQSRRDMSGLKSWRTKALWAAAGGATLLSFGLGLSNSPLAVAGLLGVTSGLMVGGKLEHSIRGERTYQSLMEAGQTHRGDISNRLNNLSDRLEQASNGSATPKGESK